MMGLVGTRMPGVLSRQCLRAGAPRTRIASASVAAVRGFSGSPARANQSFFQAMLHGSKEAQEQQSSADATQGNTNAHVYEIRRICVRADRKEEFRSALGELLPKVAQKYREHVVLAGNWEVTVGELDTFYQIWRYDSYAAYDKVWEKSREDPDAVELRKRIAPALQSHSTWLTQAFTFWKPTLPAPATGIYELRTYHLKPGNLLQWERDWRHGLEARRPYVEPVGAWFTHVGGLHTVFHIWAYPSMEQRERTRAAAWQVETWSATVNKTSPMIDKMHSQIMKALPISGL